MAIPALSMCATSFKARVFLLITVLLLSAGCATLSRNTAADCLAQSCGFEKSFLKAGQFILTSYYRFSKPGEPVRIYIEGDGNAWFDRNQLSDNPTPKSSLILELASLDPSVNVAYLARPGQYIESGEPLCDSAYWSDKRFSEEVVLAMNDAINQLCIKAQSNKVELVGYSGGGAIAVLVTARRKDVVELITIAGNLDTDAVNRYHHVSPLKGSLNPISYAKEIANIPQIHYLGSEDKIIPLFVAENFKKASGPSANIRVKVIPGATHSHGCRSKWQKLSFIDFSFYQ